MSLHLGAIQQGLEGFCNSAAEAEGLPFPEQQLASLGEAGHDVFHVNQ